MFALAQTSLAAGIYETTGSVNFREGPSTGSGVISTLNAGTKVEVLEYNAGGWSKISYNGAVGYIKSDYIKPSAGSGGALYKTKAGVNFRTGPSTGSDVIRLLSTGTTVEMLENDQSGWSKVSVNGTVGYIRSDLLSGPVTNAQQSGSTAASGQSVAGAIYRTTTGVNLRSGPSTNDDVIKILVSGTSVSMLEHDPSGWSKVSYNGTVGYIRSDYLRSGGGKVELLEWSVAKNVVPKGVPLKIVDVRTGITFTIRCFSKGGHADVEPLTKEDTEAILRSRNGVWAWAPRPVWVTIGDRTIAASMNGMPHDVSTISDNGMNGHLCLHFNGTVTNSKSYQKDLNNAVMEAWNAGQ